LLIQEHIARLDITMDDSSLMEDLERAEKLVKDFTNMLLAEIDIVCLLHDLVKSSIAFLHHDIEVSL